MPVKDLDLDIQGMQVTDLDLDTQVVPVKDPDLDLDTQSGMWVKASRAICARTRTDKTVSCTVRAP